MPITDAHDRAAARPTSKENLAKARAERERRQKEAAAERERKKEAAARKRLTDAHDRQPAAAKKRETPEQKAKRLGVPFLGKAKPPSAYANRATKRLFEPKPDQPRAMTAKEKENERKAKKLGTKTIRELSKDQHSAAMALAGRVPFIEKKDVTEAEQAVLGIPAGLFGIGKALALDVAKPKKGPFSFRGTRTGKIGEEIGKSLYRDIRHPLRNPILTALDVSGVASAGAGTVTRVGAAAGAAKVARAAGKSAPKAAAKAAIKRPLPGVRTHIYEGQPIRGRYSFNPSAHAVQKARDKRALANAQRRVTEGKAERISTIGPRKAEHLLSEQRRVTDAARKAPALRAQSEAPRHLTTHQILAKFGKKDITTPQDMAIRVYAEGVPVDQVIEYHLQAASTVERKLKNRRRGGVPGGGTSAQLALRLTNMHEALLRKAAILEEAKKYLGNEGMPPVPKGHVRLYRGEGEGYLSYKDQGLIPGDETHYFSTEREFANSHNQGGGLFYVDVPEKVARDYAAGAGNYSIPGTISAKARRVDETGRPILIDPELARKAGVTEKAALTREARLKKAGLLTLEAAERRVQAPGNRMTRTFVGGNKRHAPAEKFDRPRTIEEARVRVGELEPLVEKAIAKLAREKQKGPEAFKVKGGPRKRSKRSQAGMSDYQRRSAVGEGRYVEPTSADYAPFQPKRTGAEQARAWSAKTLYQLGSKEGAHPTLKRLADAMDELEQLQAAIHEQTAPAFAREPGAPQGSLGTISEFKGLSEAQPFTGGRFRVPDILPNKKRPHGPAAYKGGMPRPPGTVTHRYTEATRREGTYTTQTIRATAEDSLDADRHLSVVDFAKEIRPMGHKIRPADVRGFGGVGRVEYAPVRLRDPSKAEAAKLRSMLKDADIERMTPDEAARVEASVDKWTRDIFPEEGKDALYTDAAGNVFTRAAPGETIPGIVWVDKRLLNSQTKLIRGGSRTLTAVDTFQDAIKGLILYGKPGYVTPNVLGNIGFNLFQQGFLAPVNWSRAVKLDRDLAFMVDEVMGQGFSRALAEGTSSPISHTVRVAGNFWSEFVDTPFRRAAFIHEARRMGFKTPEQMRALIMEERYRGDIGEIGQRARDAIIDYERLGPLERDLVRRVLFVYPWIKGSTYYGVQFLRDHPIQAAVFTKIGQQGASQAEQELGPMPAWAQGTFKVGGSQDQPLTINPAAASNFGTPIQVAQTIGSLFGDVEQSQNIGEMTSPVFQSALEASFSKDFFSGRDLKGSWPQKFGGQIVKGLPQVLLYQRLRDANKPATQEKTYPYTKEAAIGSFVLGSSFPRPTNRKMLNEQAAGARPTGLEKLQAEAQAVLPKLHGKMPPADITYIRRAYKIAGGMETLREQARKDTGDGEPYYRAVLKAEAEYMGKIGVFPKADVDFLVKLAKSGTYDQVRKRRDALIQGPYESAYLTARRNARKRVGYTAP